MNLGVIVLAIIQGIAEFLPISSSAHLIIFRDLFGFGSTVIDSDFALAFDLALHFGTLLAIVLYFFKDFWNMVIKGLSKGVKDKEGKILWYLIIATIPAAIAGVLFEEAIEELIRSNFIIIGSALIIMGIIIYLVDKKFDETNSIKNMNLKEAFFIGCSQIFALIPGFSRSGTTIAAARSLKLNREDAAKFSFYLSAPVVAGACILNVFDSETLMAITTHLDIFIVGIMVSFISGLVCIKFLLRYLKKHDFKVFMWYRILLGGIVIIYSILR